MALKLSDLDLLRLLNVQKQGELLDYMSCKINFGRLYIHEYRSYYFIILQNHLLFQI